MNNLMDILNQSDEKIVFLWNDFWYDTEDYVQKLVFSSY